jgi:hypothetical protein
LDLGIGSGVLLIRWVYDDLISMYISSRNAATCSKKTDSLIFTHIEIFSHKYVQKMLQIKKYVLPKLSKYPSKNFLKMFAKKIDLPKNFGKKLQIYKMFKLQLSVMSNMNM